MKKKRDLTIKGLQDLSHMTATSKGWHDRPRTGLEIAALIHSEISEFVEDCRLPGEEYEHGWIFKARTVKPIGPAIELADAVIRIADFFGEKGWDLQEVLRAKLKYNLSRPYRHGGKLK